MPKLSIKAPEIWRLYRILSDTLLFWVAKKKDLGSFPGHVVFLVMLCMILIFIHMAFF